MIGAVFPILLVFGPPPGPPPPVGHDDDMEDAFLAPSRQGSADTTMSDPELASLSEVDRPNTIGIAGIDSPSAMRSLRAVQLQWLWTIIPVRPVLRASHLAYEFGYTLYLMLYLNPQDERGPFMQHEKAHATLLKVRPRIRSGHITATTLEEAYAVITPILPALSGIIDAFVPDRESFRMVPSPWRSSYNWGVPEQGGWSSALRAVRATARHYFEMDDRFYCLADAHEQHHISWC